MNLANARLGTTVTIENVSGDGSFRRRLLELGLLPGTKVTVVGVAPLGDPLILHVRGGSLSIRRAEAQLVAVSDPERSALGKLSSKVESVLPEAWAGSPS
jgi:Fe2+ transport system protein FeoA